MKIVKKYIKILASIFLFSILLATAYSVPVIPNETGFGLETPAGRGGEIYKITTLEASGSGSLKECVDASGPRICVFEVSGTIELTQHLKITNPYITIAGQTAPSPGITIKGAGIVIQASDVLIQHIRIRVGDEADGPAYDDRDALKIESKYGDIKNVVIDHVSASWATDEVFSTWSYDGKLAKDITVTNSIFSEALYNSYHPDGRHSMGALIGKNTQNILLNKNIFAYNNYRNPLIRDDSTDVIVANNYLYNPGVGSKSKIYFGTTGTNNLPMRATVVGNVFTPNPDEYYDNMVYVESGSATSFSLFVDDNSGPMGTNDDWAVVYGRTDSTIRETSPPVTISELEYLKSSEVKNYVFVNAGARPADRDSVDQRIISNMNSNTGKIIDSQNDVGGWPNLAENYREFIIPNNPNDDDDSDGYTNIEEVLHTYAAEVEGRTIEEPILLQESLVEEHINEMLPIIEEPTTTIEEPTPQPVDEQPPVLTAQQTLNLEAGTTTAKIEVNTDELAYCHYDDEPNQHYLDMSYLFDNVNTQNHIATISGLQDGQTYTYYVRCKDLNTPHNYNIEDFEINIYVQKLIDTQAPVITSSSYENTLPAGTTQTTLQLTTDELAYCHYDNEPNQHYLDMSYLFDNSNTKNHIATFTGLENGQTYTYYIRCKDLNNPHNYMMEDYVLTFSVKEPQPITDTQPPIITSVSYDKSLPAGTTSATLKLTTDELAYCHYDDEPDQHYLDMSYLFDNKLTQNHIATFNGLKDGRTYTYYIKCRDINQPDNNYMTADYEITFSINKKTRRTRR